MLARLIAFALRCGQLLPPGFAWWLGGQLGHLAAFLPGREQRRCREHLAIAYPELPEPRRELLARQVFRHLGRMGLWTLATYHREPRELCRGIVVEGPDHMRATGRACREGRGTVILSGHLGNWEILARSVGSIMPVTLLGKRMKHPAVDDLIRRLRGHGDNRVVYQDDDLRQLLRHLRDGRLLATLPDQDVGRLAGCFVPWFGRLAYTPIGPAAIAQLARCPVQPVYCYFKGGRWVQHWGPRWEVPKGRDRVHEQALVMARCMAYQELIVRRHPEQWVWFHRRWRRRPEDRPDAPVVDRLD